MPRPLSPWMQTIAECVTRGLSNREIGVELGTTKATIQTILTRIYVRMEVKSRQELIEKMRDSSAR